MIYGPEQGGLVLDSSSMSGQRDINIRHSPTLVNDDGGSAGIRYIIITVQTMQTAEHIVHVDTYSYNVALFRVSGIVNNNPYLLTWYV